IGQLAAAQDIAAASRLAGLGELAIGILLGGVEADLVGETVAERDDQVAVGLLNDVVKHRGWVGDPVVPGGGAVDAVAAGRPLLVGAGWVRVDPGVPAARVGAGQGARAGGAVVAAAAVVGQALVDHLVAKTAGGGV